MKMVVFPWIALKHSEISAAKPKETATATGVESTLILLKVPEMEVLTLQIEHEVSKNALS
jgi:hypothetical protein